MGSSFSVLYSLAMVIAVSAPTLATLDVPQAANFTDRSDKNHRLRKDTIDSFKIEDQERILRWARWILWDPVQHITPEEAFIKLKLKDSGAKLFEIRAKKLCAWVHYARKFYKDDEYSFEIIARHLIRHFGGDKQLYEALKAAKAIRNPKLQSVLEKIEAGLFMCWARSYEKVGQVLQYMSADFDIASLSVDEAATKLFKEFPLSKLVSYVKSKGEIAPYQSVAAELADSFSTETLLRKIIMAEQDMETSASAKKIATGSREHNRKEMLATAQSHRPQTHRVRTQ